MSPIAQFLPNDMICEILKSFAAPLLTRIDGKAREFPWYLGHICSSWRAAFLSMHQEFWSRFILGPAKIRTPETERQCAEIAATFLDRNNGSTFSFEIYRYSRSRLILDKFIRESARWLDVSFAIEEREVPILMQLGGCLPILHTLTLIIGPDSRPDEATREYPAVVPESYKQIFMDAPRLTSVRLSGLSTWQFDWSSLTILELIKPIANPYLPSALRNMRCLERLLVKQPRNTHYNHVGVELISLPSLRDLTVFGFGLLPLLITPSLNELYIDVAFFNPGWEIASAICASFFHRSSCSVQRLGIGTTLPPIVAQILTLTPGIRFLGFHVNPGEADFYRLLELTPGEPSIASAMQSLRITFPFLAFRYNLEPLLAMLISRTGEHVPQQSRLKELTIALGRDCDFSSIVDNLRELDQQCRARDVEFTAVLADDPDDLGAISGEYDRILAAVIGKYFCSTTSSSMFS